MYDSDQTPSDAASTEIPVNVYHQGDLQGGIVAAFNRV
jgi:hypothetical protein